jgi:hypothetical protein
LSGSEAERDCSMNPLLVANGLDTRRQERGNS